LRLPPESLDAEGTLGSFSRTVFGTDAGQPQQLSSKGRREFLESLSRYPDRRVVAARQAAWPSTCRAGCPWSWHRGTHARTSNGDRPHCVRRAVVPPVLRQLALTRAGRPDVVEYCASWPLVRKRTRRLNGRRRQQTLVSPSESSAAAAREQNRAYRRHPVIDHDGWYRGVGKAGPLGFGPDSTGHGGPRFGARCQRSRRHSLGRGGIADRVTNVSCRRRRPKDSRRIIPKCQGRRLGCVTEEQAMRWR